MEGCGFPLGVTCILGCVLVPFLHKAPELRVSMFRALGLYVGAGVKPKASYFPFQWLNHPPYWLQLLAPDFILFLNVLESHYGIFSLKDSKI